MKEKDMNKTLQQLAEIGIWNSEKAADLYYDYKYVSDQDRADLERHIDTLHQITQWVKE